MLADLARTETLKDMTPEQILAMAAAKSPELGGAIAEMAGSGSNQQATEMYERLLSEQKESAAQARGSQEDMTRAMQEMFNKALDTQAQVSQAFAQGGSQSQSGGVTETPAQPSAEQPAAQRVVVCRRCLQESEAGTRFCPNCGGSLMATPE
jgi:phage shock protein A